MVSCFRIHWRFSAILWISSKSVWINVFWYVKVCIFWKCFRYSIEIKHKSLKNSLRAKLKVQKLPSFFISQAPTHHSFIFNLWFLYDLKHRVCLSKTVCGIFHFRFRFFFIKVYIFFQQNAWTLTLKRHNSFRKLIY